MAWKHPDWEESEGITHSKLCGNPDPGHGGDDWPRIVVLDLSSEDFEEFDNNPVKFCREHNLFPEQPVLWASGCARPPLGKGIPQPAPDTRWTVTVNHAKVSMATSAAVPQSFIGPPPDDGDDNGGQPA